MPLLYLFTWVIYFLNVFFNSEIKSFDTSLSNLTELPCLEVDLYPSPSIAFSKSLIADFLNCPLKLLKSSNPRATNLPTFDY